MKNFEKEHPCCPLNYKFLIIKLLKIILINPKEWTLLEMYFINEEINVCASIPINKAGR